MWHAPTVAAGLREHYLREALRGSALQGSWKGLGSSLEAKFLYCFQGYFTRGSPGPGAKEWGKA